MTTRLTGIITLSLILAACGGPQDDGHAHDEHAGDDHGDAHAPTEIERGPNGGRLLEQAGYALELGVAEAGTPPKFQAWLYKDGKPLRVGSAQAEVRVTRLKNIVERHVLKPDGQRMLATTVVGEPHSFDVEVLATIEGKPLRWQFPSYEGRTTIAEDVAKDAGIRVAPVGPGVIADTHEVQGTVVPVDGRAANVVARFPGPIRSLRVNVGDAVRAGQVLATVESNLSLSSYGITAPLSGTVLARHASVGGVAGEGEVLFEIADLSTLWIDLQVFGADAQHVRAGAPLVVTRLGDGVQAETSIERLLPGTAAASQSTVARATIENADGLWRPGAAVKATITVDQRKAALVVPLAALQTFRDWDVVFIRVGDIYEVRPVELGRRDAERVEILSGVEPGDPIVVEQSYLIKADIEKSGASHDH